jgi:large subunit ribosomal protein L4
MKVDVVTIQGEKTGRQADLPQEAFGVKPNEHAVYLAVKQYLANQRQGTHKAKERGEVAGSTRKLHRQKGTGGSRKGDIKNPIFRGGGRVFGPRPRTYSLRLNKKVKRLARASALSAKAQAGEILVIEDFSFDAPRTKAYMDMLRSLELEAKKSILVTPETERELFLSSRNIPNAHVLRAGDLSVYDILNADTLVFAESALDKVKETFVNGFVSTE